MSPQLPQEIVDIVCQYVHDSYPQAGKHEERRGALRPLLTVNRAFRAGALRMWFRYIGGWQIDNYLSGDTVAGFGRFMHLTKVLKHSVYSQHVHRLTINDKFARDEPPQLHQLANLSHIEVISTDWQDWLWRSRPTNEFFDQLAQRPPSNLQSLRIWGKFPFKLNSPDELTFNDGLKELVWEKCLPDSSYARISSSRAPTRLKIPPRLETFRFVVLWRAALRLRPSTACVLQDIEISVCKLHIHDLLVTLVAAKTTLQRLRLGDIRAESGRWRDVFLVLKGSDAHDFKIDRLDYEDDYLRQMGNPPRVARPKREANGKLPPSLRKPGLITPFFDDVHALADLLKAQRIHRRDITAKGAKEDWTCKDIIGGEPLYSEYASLADVQAGRAALGSKD